MDDVIFAGSAARPAREQAEVVIVLDNGDRKAPAAFNDAQELEISRRIRRGMGSNYKVNGREVRAKDVQLLFADASTGANSPALVRQGQISELISAKPENRRRILEEAAGIGGLHARRHEADLKLKATETNLTRLEELVVEIEAQASSLRKQARQAERYKVVADELRRVEALLMHRRLNEAETARAAADAERRKSARAVAEAAENASVAQRVAMEASGKLSALREEEVIASAVLRRLEGVRVGLERDLKDALDAIARLEADIARADADTEREQRLLEDAQEALERLNEEAGALEASGDDPQALAAAQEQAQAADAARAEAEARLESEAAALAARRARAEAANRALHDVTGRIARLTERLEAASRERAGFGEASAQDKALKELRAAFEKASAALQAAEADSAKAEDAVTAAQSA
jgi:chromosome segregation protein